MTEMDGEGAVYGYGAPYEATDAQPDWTGYDGSDAYDTSYDSYDTSYDAQGAPLTDGSAGEAAQTGDESFGAPAPQGGGVLLGQLQLRSAMVGQTAAVRFDVGVGNQTGRDLADNELRLVVRGEPQSGQAEEVAAFHFPVNGFASGETRSVNDAIQLDAGDWLVTVEAELAGTVVATTNGNVTVTGGPTPHHIEYDDSAQLKLSVGITGVTRLRADLYQVFYTVTNHSRRALEAGLPVAGLLEDDDGATSSQFFELQNGCAPFASAPHHLTLEADVTGDFTATIILDPNGPSIATGQARVTRDASGAVTGFSPV